MPCEICGSCLCTRCFHSIQEQEEFDTKTGRYAPDPLEVANDILISVRKDLARINRM